MGSPTEQLWVSPRVKRELEVRKRHGECDNDVLERLLAETTAGKFGDGFGRWSADHAEYVRAGRETMDAKRLRWERESR
ncbi:hypothetical protein SAMN04487967_0416 [Natronorubrum sediminis]|uniref:Uncharacterized protein n=1 Tax=Natronorubrum sediminis TaxID=640943 RepID=A0A1H6FL47_9EURY|nr:hypothetical protein [Natronorubrum sediminis]SEH11576.1 hypothetical protein SAMN04487967_0416 [Natronorubrum sediminis]